MAELSLLTKEELFVPVPELKILFAGTPEFATVALNALLAASYPIVAVYTQPDRPAGRGRKPQPSPVKIRALEHHLPVIQPLTLRDPHEHDRLRAFQPDVMVVAAYGLLLPRPVLPIPPLGCLNIHASLLPRWRGAAPIQRAILAGDSETGISIMRMKQRLDSGPIIVQRACPILPTDTAATLHDRLAQLGAQAILETLAELTRTKKIISRAQDESLVTYAAKLEKNEAWLDWRRDAVELERQVRAFNPYPIAQTQSATTVIRVWQASVSDLNSAAVPGTIVESHRSGIKVATGNGTLILHKIQLPGGRPLEVFAVLNSRAGLFPPGRVLVSSI